MKTNPNTPPGRREISLAMAISVRSYHGAKKKKEVRKNSSSIIRYRKMFFKKKEKKYKGERARDCREKKSIFTLFCRQSKTI